MAGRLFASMSNLGTRQGRPDTQYLPGAVLVFDFDLANAVVGPNAGTPVILTTDFNPTDVTAYSVAGRRVVNFTSGQGIVYAMEQYYHAPGKFSTMVVEVGARALTKHALNVHCGARWLKTRACARNLNTNVITSGKRSMWP